jgi:hypothetical protein
MSSISVIYLARNPGKTFSAVILPPQLRSNCKRDNLNSTQLVVGYSTVVLIGNERRMIPNKPQIDRGLMIVIAFIIALILIWIATNTYV